MAVVARFPAQVEMAARVSAPSLVVAHEPRLAVVEALAEWSGGVLHQAFDGLPMAHPGHIDVVYDSVAKPETFEVGVRVLAETGRSSTPGWPSPVGGSGRRSTSRSSPSSAPTPSPWRSSRDAAATPSTTTSALVQDRRIDLTAMVTHRFPLEDWWDALKTLARPEVSGVLKAAFTPNAWAVGATGDSGLPADPQPLAGRVPRTGRSGSEAAATQPGRARSGVPAWPRQAAASKSDSSPAAIRARNAAPSAAPSGTATVSTGSPVASATACIHGTDRDPPPVATIRPACPTRALDDAADHEPAGLVGGPDHAPAGPG